MARPEDITEMPYQMLGADTESILHLRYKEHVTFEETPFRIIEKLLLGPDRVATTRGSELLIALDPPVDEEKKKQGWIGIYETVDNTYYSSPDHPVEIVYIIGYFE
ncbi:MAG: hypothetical protein K2F99_08535 [Muribaculaceae bacterium]|nr:hypothetical protein [Muribaculaceae bacterium]